MWEYICLNNGKYSKIYTNLRIVVKKFSLVGVYTRRVLNCFLMQLFSIFHSSIRRIYTTQWIFFKIGFCERNEPMNNYVTTEICMRMLACEVGRYIALHIPIQLHIHYTYFDVRNTNHTNFESCEPLLTVNYFLFSLFLLNFCVPIESIFELAPSSIQHGKNPLQWLPELIQ